MRQIQSEITIDEPKEKVWAVLSDITSMANYMPGVDSVRLTSDHARGVDAARYCTFADGIELHERVVAWQEGEGYTLETIKFVKAPLKSNQITFALSGDNGRTVVTQSMRYGMKGGPLAGVLERLVGGMMRKAIDGALGGLKTHVEAQR